MGFSGPNDRLGKIVQGVLLRGGVLIAAAIGRLPDETEMHPGPVFHSIGHDGKAFPQIKPPNQFVNGVLEWINLLRVSIMLCPMCDEFFTPVTRKSAKETTE